MSPKNKPTIEVADDGWAKENRQFTARLSHHPAKPDLPRLLREREEMVEALDGMLKAFNAAHNHTQAVAQDIANGVIRRARGEV